MQPESGIVSERISASKRGFMSKKDRTINWMGNVKTKFNINLPGALQRLFCLILAVYPMRHIHWGVDLWDTGYNYANFQYMGLEHMDPMWLFSTYLSNAVGHLLTLLPCGRTLVGLNLYTGLFVSALALIGYFFCTRVLRIPGWIAFAGEFLAISMCWCPTALLYNYMTYLLFLIGVILLYLGLTGFRRGYLYAAGVCLGCNVLVRFSNLPEAAMIIAVWAWAILVHRERKDRSESPWGLALRDTLACLGGYLTALFLLFGYLHIRYGMGTYVAAIKRLFGMTENATDYKATSMLYGMLESYLINLYWVLRIGCILLAGVVGFAIVNALLVWFFERGRTDRKAKARLQEKGVVRAARLICKIGFAGIAGLIPVWLYYREFCVPVYTNYGAIERPFILFLLLAMGIGALRVVLPGGSNKERLIGGMVVLIVLLTSIGSNNKVYPSMNNLFLVAPYVLWECWKFIRYAADWYPVEWLRQHLAGRGHKTEAVPDAMREKRCSPEENRWGSRIRGFVVSVFPAKAVLIAFLALVLVQGIGFGIGFGFAEATGIRNVTTVIDNNPVLKHVKMPAQRAQWMQEISAYLKEHDLSGREAVLYGEIPSMTFYLQTAPAHNPWSELDSYNSAIMEENLQKLADSITGGDREKPLVILEKDYALYMEAGADALREAGVDNTKIARIMSKQDKNEMMKKFMADLSYDLTFENEKFLIFE